MRDGGFKDDRGNTGVTKKGSSGVTKKRGNIGNKTPGMKVPKALLQ